MPRRSSRPLIRFAARERNRTNFNCLRTCAAVRDGSGRAKSLRKDPLASRYSGQRSGKGRQGFSRIISKRLSTYPSIFLVFFFRLTLTSALYAQRRSALFYPPSADRWVLDFRNAITDQEGNCRTREITSASCRRLSHLPIDISNGQRLSTNRWTA